MPGAANARFPATAPSQVLARLLPLVVQMRAGSWNENEWCRVRVRACLVLTLAAWGCGDEGTLPPHTAARVYDGRPMLPPVQLSVQRTVRLFQPEVDRTKQVRLDAQYGLVDLGAAGTFVGWSF